MYTPRISEIAHYMVQRHQIYLARKGGRPGPWTRDPILNGGRFCNVFRELDTVTQWIEAAIRKPYAQHENLWFMLCIARYINWPPTLQYLIERGYWPTVSAFDPALITRGLEEVAAMGEKVYTGAYMIRAESDPKKEWYSWTKHRYIAEIVLGRVWAKRRRFVELLAKPDVTLERVHTMFQNHEFIGWGPFMAYEVVTDLRHTRYLRGAPDIHLWANAGPGAIRGLNRLYGRELKAQPSYAQTNEEMRLLMVDLNDMAGKPKVDDPDLPTVSDRVKQLFGRTDGSWPFEMRDVEHTLCEFDKYERVRLGEGKMRSKYDWRKATPISV